MPKRRCYLWEIKINKEIRNYTESIIKDSMMSGLCPYSPGGMPDGTNIQEWNLDNIPSIRRNPVLADIFNRLGYMERQGSGLNKICDAYENAANYTSEKVPEFFANRTSFTVTLKILNFKASTNEAENEAKSEAVNEAKNNNLTEIETQLCQLLFNNEEITQKDIQDKLGLSRSELQRMMKKLTDKGIIERVWSRRKGCWKIPIRLGKQGVEGVCDMSIVIRNHGYKWGSMI